MGLRYGSVCSGIEAATVAWHSLGWAPAWFSEIEAFPCRVLAHHYPSVPNLGDMTTIAERVRRGEVEAPDVLVGGTPCQAFSVSGLRRSLEDPRGNLALAFVQLANAVEAARLLRRKPEPWILWENVPGVLSVRDNAFGSFLAGLVGADAAIVPPRGKWARAGVVSGPARVACWRVLDAQFFGVAQRRRRVFVLARGGAGAWAAADALLPLTPSVLWHPAPSRAKGKGSPGGAAAGAGERSVDLQNTRLGGDVAGTLDTTRPTRGGGQAVLEPVVAYQCRAKGTGGPSGDECQNLVPGEVIPFDTTQITSGENRCRPEPGSPSHPLAAGAHPPAIAFSMKDYGADATEDLSPTLRSGNHSGSHANGGVMPAIAFHVTQDPISGEVAPALGCGNALGCGTLGVAEPVAFSTKESGRDATVGLAPTLRAESGDPHMGGRSAVAHGMSVRRLTPRECERLQGFPDDYTAIPGAADGPRYRALGNSMAVPVMKHIAQRIEAVEAARK